eukprot:TRINITY_DN25689_c0_g1_i1.p1 TRINITY_DN25689_c0_g1~~TRINITY_DN25689_c0_g1_i1.p1  ORF type:complete len:637 (+),score=124.98 TRINITY_DN25689_c0_g1_i1:62-1972(+)
MKKQITANMVDIAGPHSKQHFGDPVCRISLPHTRYGIGISWDIFRSQVDIDLQAVIVDHRGLIMDAVYYNNLMGMGGAIGHSGDEKSGDRNGMDEVIYMKMDKLPKQVTLILFVVAAYDFGCLSHAENAKVTLFHKTATQSLKILPFEKTPADVDVVCLMHRHPTDGWVFEPVEVKATSGSHFLDILEPHIGDIIRSKIEGAPQEQSVSFVMEKGAVTDFPSTALKRLVVGIGGKLSNETRRGSVKGHAYVDIDITAIFYDRKGHKLGKVDGETNCDGMFGVTHSGDQVAGAKYATEMDDEAIAIDLLQIPSKVFQIFLVLSIPNGTFAKISSAYTRVCDQNCTELSRYNIKGGQNMSGLIVGRILRSPGDRWGFQAVGKFFSKTDVHKMITKLFYNTPDPSKAPRGSSKAKKATQTTSPQATPEAEQAAADEAAEENHIDRVRRRVASITTDKVLKKTLETFDDEIMRSTTDAMLERLVLLQASVIEGDDEDMQDMQEPHALMIATPRTPENEDDVIERRHSRCTTMENANRLTMRCKTVSGLALSDKGDDDGSPAVRKRMFSGKKLTLRLEASPLSGGEDVLPSTVEGYEVESTTATSRRTCCTTSSDLQGRSEDKRGGCSAVCGNQGSSCVPQ